MILYRNNYREDERLFSTGDSDLDDLLEEVYYSGISDGYDYAQKEFGKVKRENKAKKRAELVEQGKEISYKMPKNWHEKQLNEFAEQHSAKREGEIFGRFDGRRELLANQGRELEKRHWDLLMQQIGEAPQEAPREKIVAEREGVREQIDKIDKQLSKERKNERQASKSWLTNNGEKVNKARAKNNVTLISSETKPGIEALNDSINTKIEGEVGHNKSVLQFYRRNKQELAAKAKKAKHEAKEAAKKVVETAKKPQHRHRRGIRALFHRG